MFALTVSIPFSLASFNISPMHRLPICWFWYSLQITMATSPFSCKETSPTRVPLYSIWHSPQLKQGDSCFFHYCIGKYLTILQCLTQCPQAIFILFPYALRYSFLVFMQTASAVLSSEYWCLHSYPGHEPHGNLDIPRYECADFLPADSGSRRNCRSGCLDTSLVLCGFHFHTK